MPIHKTPQADLRGKHRLYQSIGLAASLAVVLGAVTVPLPEGEAVLVIETDQEMVQIETVEQTRQTLPPPPPPAALPPPQEVPDDVALEEDVIEEITLDLNVSVPPPPAPPAPSAAPPPPPPSTTRAPPDKPDGARQRTRALA